MTEDCEELPKESEFRRLRMSMFHFLMFCLTNRASVTGFGFVFLNLLAITSDIFWSPLRLEKSGIISCDFFLLLIKGVWTTEDAVLGVGEGDLQYSDNGSSNKSGVSMVRSALLPPESSDLVTSSVRV